MNNAKIKRGRPRKDAARICPQALAELAYTQTVEQIALQHGITVSSVRSRLRRIGAQPWLSDRYKGLYSKLMPGIRMGIPTTQHRHLLAVVRKGSSCEQCGNKDVRVLELNHINGEGRGSVSRYGPFLRSRRSRYAMEEAVVFGKSPDYINLLCANCNWLHEYSRKNLSAITDDTLRIARMWADFYNDPWNWLPRGFYCHGLSKQAAQLRIAHKTLLRLIAVFRMGGVCISCSTSDVRVLHLNHQDGDGVEFCDSLGYRVRYATSVVRQFRSAATSEIPAYFNLLCRNCNILHEYERGARADITQEHVEAAQEGLAVIDIREMLFGLRRLPFGVLA